MVYSMSQAIIRSKLSYAKTQDMRTALVGASVSFFCLLCRDICVGFRGCLHTDWQVPFFGRGRIRSSFSIHASHAVFKAPCLRLFSESGVCRHRMQTIPPCQGGKPTDFMWKIRFCLGIWIACSHLKTRRVVGGSLFLLVKVGIFSDWKCRENSTIFVQRSSSNKDWSMPRWLFSSKVCQKHSFRPLWFTWDWNQMWKAN